MTINSMAELYDVTRLTIINTLKKDYGYAKVYSSGLKQPPFGIFVGAPFVIVPPGYYYQPRAPEVKVLVKPPYGFRNI